MKKRYKIHGSGYPVTFTKDKEFAMDKTPSPGLIEHVSFPPVQSHDIIAFNSKYVESGPNLNMAYFAIDELLRAYQSIPYKALDMEHNLDEIIGHIYYAKYVNREDNQEIIPDEEMLQLDPVELNKLNIDVVAGGIVYVDRFPEVEGPLSRKSYSISMEAYFDDFDLLLENGLRLSIEEAEALGLSQFVDQLMGEFETEEEFDRAHTIVLRTKAGKNEELKVFKYLKTILFSGGGLVLNPACPSCHVLSTDRDEECSCRAAASVVVDSDRIKLYTLDISDNDQILDRISGITIPRIQIIETGGNRTIMAGKDGVPKDKKDMSVDKKGNPEDTTTSGSVVTDANPSQISYDPLLKLKQPAICPQYKAQVWIGQTGTTADPVYVGSDDVVQYENWCMYGDAACPVAGERMWHDCLRWTDEGDGFWSYDTRTFKEENMWSAITEDMGEATGLDDISDAALQDIAAFKRNIKQECFCNKRHSLGNIVEKWRLALEVFEQDRELSMPKPKPDKGRS
jgi:hypothetical protein